MKHTRKILVALLVLMTILMSLAVVAIPASAAEETVRVYCNDNANWADVYCYTWNPSTNTPVVAWPGTKVETVDENGLYYFDIPVGNKCIFNNNAGKQSPDLEIPANGKLVYANGNKTVYVDVSSAEWTTVKCYYWGGSSNSWPGTNMKKVEGEDYLWEFTLPGGAGNVIFNNGSKQTVDLTAPIFDGAVYTLGGLSGGKYTATVHYHNFADATCTEPQKCSCGATKGTTIAHDYVDNFCSACGALDPECGWVLVDNVDDLIANAKVADSKIYVKEGTYTFSENIGLASGVQIVGLGDVLFEGTLSGTLDNVTLKNLHIKGGNAQRWAYAKGALVFENVTFEATSVYALHFDGITAGATILYKDCTIIGWAAMSGSPASCEFTGCTIKGNGSYGLIRTYFDAKIEDCTFDVSNVNPDDVYQDGIHAVDATITVDNCTNVNGEMKEIIDTSKVGYVVLDGETIHIHKHEAGETVAPTCSSAGYTVYTCPCGDTYNGDEVEALAHKDTGLDAKCDACGKYFVPASPFKLGMYQKNKGGTYFFKGSMSNYYFATTNMNNVTGAVDVYAEETDGGYYLYFMSGTTTNYLYIEISGSYTNIKYGSTKAVWRFDEQFGTFFTKVNGTEYYMGTYSNYVTISANKASYITGSNASKVDVSQFVARPMSLVDHVCTQFTEKVTKPTCTAQGYTTKTCNACGVATKVDYVDALGHDLVAVEAKAPTFDATGYTAHLDCSRCTYTEGKETLPKLIAVATADGDRYTTLAEALENGSEIVLLMDIELDAPIVLNGSYTLDLNGFTLSYATDVWNENMITIKGELIVSDSASLTRSGSATGAISFVFTGEPDTSYGKGNYAIVNSGSLTINSGLIQVAADGVEGTFSHALYAIQNAGELTINGGEVINNNNVAIRNWNDADITVNGGTISGTRAIWVQLPSGASAAAPEINIAINGGTLTATEQTYNLAIYVYSYGQSAEKLAMNINGGTFNGNVSFDLNDSTLADDAITVTGGVFNSDYGVFSYCEDDALAASKIAITGGEFKTNYSAIYAEDDGFIFVQNAEGSFSTLKGSLATPSIKEVDGVKYWFIGTVNTGVKAEGIDGDDGIDGLPGADGKTPYIGENGNWWIGETDTGVKAEGTNGANGTDGANGTNGTDGKTPYIGENGNWWIGETDTGVKAEGTDGNPGVDGNTPYIGENGNWWIGETDTGVKAEGVDGTNGTNGTNGTDGKDGVDGIDGKDGKDADATKAIYTATAVATVAIIFALAVLLFWRVRRRSWWAFK